MWFGGGFRCVPIGGLGSPAVSVTAGTVGAGASGHRRLFRPPEFCWTSFSATERAAFPRGGLGFFCAASSEWFFLLSSSLPPAVAVLGVFQWLLSFGFFLLGL